MSSTFRNALRRQFQKYVQRPQSRAESSSPSSATTSSSSSSSSSSQHASSAPTTATSTTPSSKATPSTSISSATGADGKHVSIWRRLGPITRAGEAYGRTQRRRPYVTQIISSLIVYGAADISAQSVRGEDYDALRTGRGLIIGAIASIPAYRWFIWLSQSFNYSSRALSMATRVLVSQTIFTTLFNTYFFGAHALLAGQGLDAAVQRVRDAVPTSWVNSCKLWPLVTVVSLTFVPLEFRSIFTGVIGIGWQTYLSFLNSRAESRDEAVTRDERGGLPVVAAATGGAPMAMAS